MAHTTASPAATLQTHLFAWMVPDPPIAT